MIRNLFTYLGSSFITFNLNAQRRRKALRELHIFLHNYDEPYCYSHHGRAAYWSCAANFRINFTIKAYQSDNVTAVKFLIIEIADR